MIEPTIGRVIWYTPPPADRLAGLANQPWPAFITYVHGNRMINIAGFNSNGTQFSRNSVRLLQDDDKPYYEGEPVASWMPHQVNQAAAQNAVVGAVAPAVSADPRKPLEVAVYGPRNLIKTPLSQQLVPAMWLYTNLQARDNAPRKLSAETGELARIRTNVGCDAHGKLQAAAFRGFAQSGSRADDDRLARANSTVLVYDIKPTANGGFALDNTKPLLEALGWSNPHPYPILYAVRIGDEYGMDELDAWVRLAAQTINAADD